MRRVEICENYTHKYNEKGASLVRKQKIVISFHSKHEKHRSLFKVLVC